MHVTGGQTVHDTENLHSFHALGIISVWTSAQPRVTHAIEIQHCSHNALIASKVFVALRAPNAIAHIAPQMEPALAGLLDKASLANLEKCITAFMSNFVCIGSPKCIACRICHRICIKTNG